MKNTIAKEVIEMTVTVVKNRKALGKEVTDSYVKSTIVTLTTMNGLRMLDVSKPSTFDKLISEILEESDKL